eukprot:2875347-Lingulodinium_polyedra.AAC.1
MSPTDQAVRLEAMKEELRSLDKRDAYAEVTAEDIQKRYWSKIIRTRKIPARCLLVKKPHPRW